MDCVPKRIAFTLIPVLVSQGSGVGVCASLPHYALFKYSLDVGLSFHFHHSAHLRQFLSYFSGCQMVTFIEGFLDFSPGRGKFFLFLFASLPSVFNLLL